MKKTIVLLKTHLDVGFTDFSANVVQMYYKKFIPKAIALGKQLFDMNCKAEFVWTAGS